MAFFTWNNSYSVGVRQFDGEHQKLFSIMNDLYDGMAAEIVEGIISSAWAACAGKIGLAD